eukprot:gene32212-38960_t
MNHPHRSSATLDPGLILTLVLKEPDELCTYTQGMGEVYDLLDKGYTANYATEHTALLTPQDFELNFDYVVELITVDAAILAAGLAALFLFWFAMLFRCCIPCCRCAPKEKLDDDSDEEEGTTTLFHPWSDYRAGLEISFYTCFLLLLGFDIYLLIGNSYLSDGIADIRRAFQAFDHLTVGALDDQAELLQDYGDDLAVQLDQAKTTCAYLSTQSASLESSLQTYQDTVDTFLDATSALHDMNRNVLQVLQYYADGAIFYCIFGIIVLFPFLQVMSHALMRQRATQTALWWNNGVYLIVILVNVIWCLFTLLTGDFCTEPSYNLAVMLGGKPDNNDTYVSDRALNITLHYATCYGTSYVDEQLNEAYSTLRTFQEDVNAASSLPGCSNNPSFASMQATLLDIDTSLGQVSWLVECSDADQSIHHTYDRIVYSGICDNGIKGLFSIWGSHIFCAIFLLGMIIIGSLLYPHYPPVKDTLEEYAVVAVDEEDDEDAFPDQADRRELPPLRSDDSIGGIVHRALGGADEEENHALAHGEGDYVGDVEMHDMHPEPSAPPM